MEKFYAGGQVMKSKNFSICKKILDRWACRRNRWANEAKSVGLRARAAGRGGIIALHPE